MKSVIGIDIGGTSIKFAEVKRDGKIINQWSIPTNTSEDGKYIIDDIVESMEANTDLENIEGIGIGTPGFVDHITGHVYQAVNLGWKHINAKDILEKRLHLPVSIDNDANLAALGEMWVGSGEGSENVLFITLGTGVGGGIIVDGNLVHGVNGMGGEIGHATMFIENGDLCGCGRYGCLETVASATGIANIAKKKNPSLKEITAKEIFEKAEIGEKFYLEVVHESMKYLGLFIANFTATINPDMVIIGGGVSEAGDFLINIIDKYVKEYALPRAEKVLTIKTASLGNEAGIYGAAYLAIREAED